MLLPTKSDRLNQSEQKKFKYSGFEIGLIEYVLW